MMAKSTRTIEAEEGRRWAREWRERRKPYFDALYGPGPSRCPCCGRLDT
jgi:hypothetical protein